MDEIINIILDTNAWLKLLEVDIHPEYNYFDEILYWIEKRYVICITTVNMIREWERHKVNSKLNILTALQAITRDNGNIFSTTTPIDTIYDPRLVEEKLDQRIERLDFIFKTIAEVAIESDEIYIRAAKRNLDCLPPNHKADSYRDTINLLSLINHLKLKCYKKCIFSTNNLKDFSDPVDRYKIHPLLELEFSDNGVTYVFFDIEKSNFARKLFEGTLRKLLPSFLDYLKDKKESEESARKSAEVNRSFKGADIDIPDTEFVMNCIELDRIAAKQTPTALDKHTLDFLFSRHLGYETYFLRKLAENGMV